MAQTSVDWLVEQLPQIDWDDPYYVGLLQEANKMFEQQIINACIKFGNLNGVDVEDYEEYYNETYNK